MMFGATTSSKCYGRGGTSVAVDSVFSRQSSTDPFLFDSDGEGTSNTRVKAKTVAPAKKKTKLKSSSRTSKSTSAGKPDIYNKLPAGRAKNSKPISKQAEDYTVAPRRHNTRTHSSSSSMDSPSNYPPMQISSTTVHQSDEVDSDFENTVPSMTISSQTVLVSDDNSCDRYDTGRHRDRSASPQKSASTVKSGRSLRSSTRSTTSSIDSRDSTDVMPLKRVDSDRLDDFLRLSDTQSKTFSTVSHTSLNNISSLSVESDRLKRFLGVTQTKPKSPSSSSSESIAAATPEESDHLKAFLGLTNSKLISSVSSDDSAPTAVLRESHRLKDFLGSTKSKPRTPSLSSCDSLPASVPQENNVQFSSTRSKAKRYSISSCESLDNTTPQESDRLKNFLQTPQTLSTNKDTSCTRKKPVGTKQNHTSSNKHSTATSCKTSLKLKTNVYQNKRPTKDRPVRATSNRSGVVAETSKLIENDRLQKFLQSETDVHSGSTSCDSESSADSADKTLVPTQTPKESKRLQEFLGTSATNTNFDSVSRGTNSSSGTPTAVLPKSKKSSQLAPFLQSDSTTNNKNSSPERPYVSLVRLPNKRGKNTSKQNSKKSGLSQGMDEIHLDIPEDKDHFSPPKRRLVDDGFSFDSDNEYAGRKETKLHLVEADEANPKASISLSSSTDSIKPVINFEKMEGRKSKPVSKPIRKLLGSPGKSAMKYRYNHRAWLNDQAEEQEDLPAQNCKPHSGKAESLKHSLHMNKIVKYPEKLGEKISTQVKVRQAHKQLYTVVRNVRQAHECQDHGENQQIDDDLEFLLEGLEQRGAMSSRYLSAVSLASKCTNASFRMHLRSHSSLAQIFTSLSDAPTDPRLALSTTAIMFMLCQDRLNMDLDRGSLKLMVQLLEYDDRAHLDNKQDMVDYEKSVDTVYELYKSAIPDGEELLDKSDLSPGYLAMECLLVLTSRRSGDWFKEELREAGAIICIADSIIDKTVSVMSTDYDMELSPYVLILIKKICRGLRVLEHVTAYNASNQRLIILHKGGEFVLSLCRLLMFGVEAIPTHCIDSTSPVTSAGYLILQKMLGVLRVLVNITHDSEKGCAAINSFSGVVDVLLKCVLQSSQYVLEEQKFDLLVLGIGLSINMCEHSANCRQTLLDTETLSSYDSICEQETMTAAEALIQLFSQRLRAAAKIEAETGQLKESEITRVVGEELNESITEVLHKAGRHMEDTIVASYIALLMGVIVQNSPDYIDQIKEYLTDHSFEEIIEVLQKFLNFMKMADAASGNTSSKSIGTVIAYLKECA